MAKFTNVANKRIKAGITAKIKGWYLDSVEEFAEKYGNPSTITIGLNEKREGFVTNGNYRLDLQGTPNGYANIQAQFGVGQTNGGSFGGVLLACGVPFSVGDVQEGLRRSLESEGKFLVQLDVDEKPIDIVPPSGKARFKTKPGKEPWTLGKVYK